MKRLLDVSLETKINGIFIGIISIIIISISSFILYDTSNEYYENAERLSLQSAKTISFLPSLVDNLELSEEEDIQAIANQYIYENDVDFVIIKDKNGVIITHPNPSLIGEHEAFNDDDIYSQVFGAYHTYRTERYQDPAIVSAAPIYVGTESRTIEGIVKAGYFESSIMSNIMDKLYLLLILAVVFILLSMIVSRLFSLYIKSETLGYEPKEITTILKNRENIFSSLNEGIIASDISGSITYLNKSASKFLSLSDKGDSKKDVNIFSLLPSDLRDLFQSDEATVEKYFETNLNGKKIVILMRYLYEKEGIVGRVFLLRDMSEVVELTNKLTVTESLFDDLRAQSHEYKNKLHLISGLLEMDKFYQIREVLNDEISNFDTYNRSLTHIKEEHIKALLIAKMNKASEKRIAFLVHEDSQLDKDILNDKILNSLITIISNLIDNAVEAVIEVDSPQVKFYIGHFDGWLEIIVEDNGSGFKKNDKILEKGYSTKGNEQERGYGLYNVITNINMLDGYLDYSHNQKRTSFIVEIPFSEEGE